MATKYTILETAHTEESEPFSSKAKAVEAADAAAEEYPGTPFRVATGKGTVVHTAFAESVDVVDDAPADEVPEVQVDTEDAGDAEDFDAALAEVVGGDALEPEQDNDADSGEDNTPGDNGDTAGQDGDEEDSDADSELDEDDQQAMRKLAASALGTGKAETPGGSTFVSGAEAAKAVAALGTEPAETPAAAPAGATLELCAANTNAKRMHYRAIGETRTACGSANTSRRANAHQIETASLCPACQALATGKTVDSRPAGAARGTRKAPKRLVVDAGEIRDLVAHLKQGLPYSMELADGTRIEVVGGDPASGELDEPEKDNLSDIRSINIVSS